MGTCAWWIPPVAGWGSVEHDDAGAGAERAGLETREIDTARDGQAGIGATVPRHALHARGERPVHELPHALAGDVVDDESDRARGRQLELDRRAADERVRPRLAEREVQGRAGRPAHAELREDRRLPEAAAE